MLGLKKKVLLEDWKFHSNATPYTAPEAVCSWLTGKVFGHPDHEDGTLVTTTNIKKRKGLYVRTRNNKYILGKEA